MQMLQQVIEGQREAKESQEKIRHDIRNIKHINNEIREKVNLATTKADEAQTKANEATSQAKENSLKITKLEKEIKTIKTMQSEANNCKDETMEEVKTTNQGVEQNKKDIMIANNKIYGLYTSMEIISRDIATKTASNISVDNPEISDPLALTNVEIVQFQIQQQMKQAEQHKAAKYIMDIARKRVGLKPVTSNHISQQAKRHIKDNEINNPENNYYRKMAAHDFLENELKVTTATIISSKLSTTSPILWIEVQGEEIALSIQKQSAILKREERAIMYPPPEFFRTIKSVENNCKEKRKKNKDLRYMVNLGPDNIELWTKQLREPQYSQQLLTVFGEIEEPNIELIITTPNFGQIPPKGREKPLSFNTTTPNNPPRNNE